MVKQNEGKWLEERQQEKACNDSIKIDRDSAVWSSSRFLFILSISSFYSVARAPDFSIFYSVCMRVVVGVCVAASGL